MIKNPDKTSSESTIYTGEKPVYDFSKLVYEPVKAGWQ